MVSRVEVRRSWPTWQVLVGGSVRYSGLWRLRSARRLAAGISHN